MTDDASSIRTVARNGWALGMVVVLSGAALAGCSTAQPGASPVPTSVPQSTSPSAAPEATTAPTPSTPAGGATNRVGMEFVMIPAGQFRMGSPDSDPEATDVEKPQHEVTISRAFELGRFEVTQQQWESVMGSNPYTLDRSNPFYNLPGMAERITRPDHPATVSWDDAQTFLDRLNEQEGGDRYRLPTEAEWEYAARAGTTTAYSFGDDEAELERFAWFSEDFATGGTHPVGEKPANPWGLHDVHGNAWEWVQDTYSDDYYATSPAVDPTGPAEGSDHPVRGGSWHETSTSWRTAFRKSYEADYRGISIGFRVVRTAA